MGSSSCRPLLQGMMLFALLPLASIQAADPVMEIADVGEQLSESLWDMAVKKAPEQVAKTFLTESGKKPGWGDLSKGAKRGLKVHKYLCKAQGWMDKQNPGGASGTPPYYAVGIRGGDLVPKIVPTFSYSVTSQGGGNSGFTCWSPNQLQVRAAGTTLVPSRYPPIPNDVRITGIRVGQEQVPVQTPAYVSTAQP